MKVVTILAMLVTTTSALWSPWYRSPEYRSPDYRQRRVSKVFIDPFERVYSVPENTVGINMDGVMRFVFNRKVWDTHFEFLGKNTYQQIAHGKAALAFFLKRFGVNLFKVVSHSDLLGYTSFENYDLKFEAFSLDPETNTNAHTETVGTKSKVYQRARVSSAGWHVTLKQAFTPPYGAEWRSTIPAGAILTFGDYFIPTVKEGALSGINIHIQYKCKAPTLTVVKSPSENELSLITSYDLKCNKFGLGQQNGIEVRSAMKDGYSRCIGFISLAFK